MPVQKLGLEIQPSPYPAPGQSGPDGVDQASGSPTGVGWALGAP